MKIDPLKLPEILNIPDKLIPMIEGFESHRYTLLEGGRGGGKSQSICRFIIWLCDKYLIRCVCAREQQVNIAESVYSIFVDLITKYNLEFDVQSTKIISRNTGSTINFRGLNEKGRFNVQGLENVSLLFCDEAQALSQRTLTVLTPTIRRDDAKIFFSMNRYEQADPVYKTFAHRDDCNHIHINYDDNPHCTQALKNEAEECRRTSERDYLHIWKGLPLDQTDDAVFAFSDFEKGKQHAQPLAQGYGLKVMGVDIARFGNDTCAAVVLTQTGALKWEETYVDEWSHKDLVYSSGRIMQIVNEQKVDMVAIDEDGIGAGALDNLTHGGRDDYIVGFRNPSIGYQTNKDFCNPRTINAFAIKKMLSEGHLYLKDKKMIDELLTIKYEFDNQQRRVLVSKAKMRKGGIPSPNRADAVIMSIGLIDRVRQRQADQYNPQIHQTYSDDGDLYNIAGIH
jgi:phage terminase large subunit